jgi:hypothetical protein
MFLVTLYLQFILGHDPVRTGLFFLTFSLPFVLVGAVSGKLDQVVGLRRALGARRRRSSRSSERATTTASRRG